MLPNVSKQVLNRRRLNAEELHRFDALRQSPVTILQIGEGNFLRGFFDWMIHECRKKGLYAGSIAVTQPRRSGKANIETLQGQDGLYTLVVRGLEQGNRIEQKEIISVFSQVFDPYSDWLAFLALAESADLQFVVSNTTEAGLVYRPEALAEGKPPESFPGKLALLLYRRYRAFGGDAGKGLIFLPCELLGRNGDELKDCVLRYSADWGLPENFLHWVRMHNRFLNSLVDRIVTGYPKAEADAWFAEWGYTDEMLDTAEPYYFWAIEGEPELDERLPLNRAGLNVQWVDDLTRYQTRKVRILNGAHTLMTPLGILSGFGIVRDVMEDPDFSAFVRDSVEQEIIPSLPFPRQEMLDYAADVYERFGNPFIDHRLSDIAMNSLSKFKTRLLPTLVHYAENKERLPDRLLKAFAGLLRYCRVIPSAEGITGETFSGVPYTVRDDAKALERIGGIWLQHTRGELPLDKTVARLLGLADIWGNDLTAIDGLAGGLTLCLIEMEGNKHE